METVTSTLVTNTVSEGINIWFYISLLQFAYIIMLYIGNRKAKPSEFKDAKESNIDMDGLFDSINNSRDLYKELSREYHPDRFVGSDEQEQAEAVFKLINKNKHNVQELRKIKEQYKTL